MRTSTLFFLVAFTCVAVCTTSADSPVGKFSNERAFDYLKVIAGTIGPRPMGSPNEARAMHYALERLKAFGCQDTGIMPMKVAAGVNTNSGIAIGVLKGKTGRIIIVGGHIDSVSPEVDGADDDGSGAACVLEIARVLGQKEHESTILFCLWGGEEQGLRGSEYFVANYPLIDSVKLMFQLDMVDGAGPLDIDPDGAYQQSSARWLVNATYEEFFRDPTHTGLRYPTQFATINSAGSGATGSDHASFIGKGIPAIDFTSDVEFPIHTPLDKLSNFTPTGFTRAGETVIALVERFDAGQPSPKLEKYWLIQLGSVPLFVPYWAIYAYSISCVIAAIGLFIVLLRRERVHPPLLNVSWSGAKIALVALVVNCFIWMAPTIIGELTGYRYPWAARFGEFVGYSLLVGSIGLSLMLRWLLKVNISYRVAPMFLRAIIGPMVLTILAAAFGLELMLYPATLLLLFIIAVALRRSWVGAAVIAVSVVLVFKFFLGEATGLFQMGITGQAASDLSQGFMYHSLFILIPTVLTLPLFYTAAAMIRSAGKDSLGLKWFASTWGLIASGGMALIAAGILIAGHPYSAKWTPAVRVRQAWNSYDTTGKVGIHSSEAMRGTVIHWAGGDTLIARATSVMIPGRQINPDAWCRFSSTDSILSTNDSLRTIEYRLTVFTRVRPLDLTVSFSSDTPIDGYSPLWSLSIPRKMIDSREDPGDKRRVFKFFAFPDTCVTIPVRFTLRQGQVLRQSIEATFDTLDTPVTIEQAPGYVIKRMGITRSDTLRSLSWHQGFAAIDAR